MYQNSFKLKFNLEECSYKCVFCAYFSFRKTTTF